MTKKKWQMSERFILAYLLSIVGGYLGVYTYLTRGGVFASAQTGNIILLGIHLANGNYGMWYQFVVPILVFLVGVSATETLRRNYKYNHLLHWREIIVTAEILLIVITSFIPIGDLNVYANLIIAFASGLQAQAFKRFQGNTMTTTRCTGNLRFLSEELFFSIHYRDKARFLNDVKCFGIILFFLIGVIVGAIAANNYGQNSILGAGILLVIVQIMMWSRTKTPKKEKIALKTKNQL